MKTRLPIAMAVRSKCCDICSYAEKKGVQACQHLRTINHTDSLAAMESQEALLEMHDS